MRMTYLISIDIIEKYRILNSYIKNTILSEFILFQDLNLEIG